jgi:hypothetical protein
MHRAGLVTDFSTQREALAARPVSQWVQVHSGPELHTIIRERGYGQYKADWNQEILSIYVATLGPALIQLRAGCKRDIEQLQMQIRAYVIILRGAVESRKVLAEEDDIEVCLVRLDVFKDFLFTGLRNTADTLSNKRSSLTPSPIRIFRTSRVSRMWLWNQFTMPARLSSTATRLTKKSSPAALSQPGDRQ